MLFSKNCSVGKRLWLSRCVGYLKLYTKKELLQNISTVRGVFSTKYTFVMMHNFHHYIKHARKWVFSDPNFPVFSFETS